MSRLRLHEAKGFASAFGYTLRRQDGEYRITRLPEVVTRYKAVASRKAWAAAERRAYYTDDLSDALDTMLYEVEQGL